LTNPKPESIQSGGFEGGTFVQAARDPAAGQNLQNLAESLSSFNKSATDAAYSNARSSGIAATKELELTGKQTGQQLIAQNMGHDTDEWNSLIDTDPNVRTVLENPYAAAAVSKHRGMLRADELAMEATKLGIDPADTDALNEFYQANAPAGELDAFFSAGFNSQNARHRATFTAQGISRNAAALVDETKQAANSTFLEALGTEPLTPEAVTEAFAIFQDPAFKNLSGPQKTQLQVNVALKLAGEGNVEDLKALVSTPRGSAPALDKSVGTQEDVAGWIATAERVREGDYAARDATLKLSLYERIDTGSPMTLGSLKERPEWDSLTEQGQLASYLHFEADQNSRSTRAAAGAARDMVDALKANALAQNNVALTAGRGWMLENGEAQDSIDSLRGNALGGKSYDALGPDDMGALKAWSGKLAMGNHPDKQLTRYLTGGRAFGTPETLVGNEEDLGQAFNVYRSLDPDVAAMHVTDAGTQSLYEKMDDISSAYPGMPLDKVAVQAVTFIDRDAAPFQLDEKAMREAIADAELGGGERIGGTSWGPVQKMGHLKGMPHILGGEKRTEPTEINYNTVASFVRQRTLERYMVNGGDTEAALEGAIKDINTNFADVNGFAVQLPNAPSGKKGVSYETPETFAIGAESYLTNAFGDSGSTAKLAATDIPNIYRVIPPEGAGDDYEPFITADGLREAGAAAVAVLRADEQAAADERARKAIAKQDKVDAKNERKALRVLQGDANASDPNNPEPIYAP
jgi:hypothetical protein